MTPMGGNVGVGQWLGNALARNLLSIAMLTLFAVVLPLTPIVQPFNDFLSDKRASAAPRTVSNGLVYLAIDKMSLDQIGVWPWPRSVYADIIDRLVKAQAADIFLDVDFSNASDAANDARLAAALVDAGGSVILPVFLQPQSAGGDDALAISKPISAFADNAWLATANVMLEPDGLVRKFPSSQSVDGELLPSVPSLLSGAAEVIGDINIDFSISPQAVEVISVADVLSNKTPDAKFRGRSVVVGAYATELKDIFSVPVHGVISGPMLHVLADSTAEPSPKGYRRISQRSSLCSGVARVLCFRTDAITPAIDIHPFGSFPLCRSRWVHPATEFCHRFADRCLPGHAWLRFSVAAR